MTGWTTPCAYIRRFAVADAKQMPAATAQTPPASPSAVPAQAPRNAETSTTPVAAKASPPSPPPAAPLAETPAPAPSPSVATDPLPQALFVRERAQGAWNGISLRVRLLCTAVLLPPLLALGYYGLLASPMYVSEARFAVRGADNAAMAAGIASMLLSGGGSVGADAHIVAEYIQSPDIMAEIDEEMGILRHFAGREHDALSRLAADATQDKRLSYWKWAVVPTFDPDSGIIGLSVKAYDAATAQRLAEAVLARSEALVNAMSRRAQSDAVALAHAEVSTAEKRVSRAQEALRAFRDRSGMLDPVSTAGGLQGIVSQLEGEAVRLRAEIAEARSFMSDKAPAAVALRARLEAVEKQLAEEKLRLTGAERSDSLNAVAGEYEDLLTESEFARKQLLSAMTSLEAARVKAEAKSRYVVAFQRPTLPDESLYPRPFLFAAYAFFAALVLVGLLSLIVAAVREHAGF